MTGRWAIRWPAVKRRVSSLADEQYRDLFGEAADDQDQHQAYDREGQVCRRCRAVIVRVKSGGRSTSSVNIARSDPDPVPGPSDQGCRRCVPPVGRR